MTGFEIDFGSDFCNLGFALADSPERDRIEVERAGFDDFGDFRSVLGIEGECLSEDER